MDETSISRKLDLSEAKAKYDEYAKSLLSEKIILALVMTESQKTYFYVEKVFLSKAGIFFIYFC